MVILFVVSVISPVYRRQHPLLSWPHWSGKKQLREIMMPSSPYLDQGSLFGRGTKYNTFRPPLDYPVAAGPLFAHEW